MERKSQPDVQDLAQKAKGHSKEEIEQLVMEAYPEYKDSYPELFDKMVNLLLLKSEKTETEPEAVPVDRTPILDTYPDPSSDEAEQLMDLIVTPENVTAIEATIRQLVESHEPDLDEKSKRSKVESLSKQFRERRRNFLDSIVNKSKLDILYDIKDEFPSLRPNERLLDYYAGKLYISPEETKIDNIMDELRKDHPDIADKLLDKETLIEYQYDDDTIKKWVDRNFVGIPEDKKLEYTDALISWKNSELSERQKTESDKEKERELEKTKEEEKELDLGIVDIKPIAYNSVLEVLEGYYNKPYTSITDEELSKVLNEPDMYEDILSKVAGKVIEYQNALWKKTEKLQKTKGIIKEPPRVHQPTREEIHYYLSQALERNKSTEKKRQEATRAREDILKRFDVPVEYQRQILESIGKAPVDILKHVSPGVGESAYDKGKFLVVTEPDLYTFDLGKYISYLKEQSGLKYIMEDKKRYPEGIKDHLIVELQKAGFPIDTGDVYRMKGKEKINSFIEALNKSFAQPNGTSWYELRRVATYFSLFKDFDLAGPSWVLDEGVKQIMRKPIDTEKIVKEGGYWEHNVGDKVMMDTDIGPMQAVITAKLPSRKYMIKNNSGIEQEVKEEQLFTSDSII